MSLKRILPALGGVVAIIIALALLGHRIAQKHIALRLAALKTGLIRCYETAAPGPGAIVTPDGMRAVIDKDLNAPAADPHLLPSFVKAGDVYFARATVEKGSHQIVCVVRLGNAQYFALKADRDCAVLNQASIDAWEHTE